MELERERLLCCSFNQDHSCFSIGTNTGYKVYNCDTGSCCYEKSSGGVCVVEMLFASSLLALVGAGEQPELSPRRLLIYNTATEAVAAELDFLSAVLAVRWNKKRIVIVLERQAIVRDIPQLNRLVALDTALNTKGLCAFAANVDNCHLALPASSNSGVVFIYDALNLNALCQFQAHKSPLAAMAFSEDGLLLATASEQGTVIRVHSIPQSVKTFTFRRGTYPATIYSLSFGPASLSPQLLAATSSSGTLHIFRLCPPARQGNSSVVSSLLAVMPDQVSDMVEPDHHYATVRNRFPSGVRSTCAIAGPPTDLTTEQASNSLSLSSSSPSSLSSSSTLVARIFVVSANWCFNQYHLTSNASGEGLCTLEQNVTFLYATPTLDIPKSNVRYYCAAASFFNVRFARRRGPPTAKNSGVQTCVKHWNARKQSRQRSTSLSSSSDNSRTTHPTNSRKTFVQYPWIYTNEHTVELPLKDGSSYKNKSALRQKSHLC